MSRLLNRSNECTPLSHSSRSCHKSLLRCSPERHEPLPRRVESIFLSWNSMISLYTSGALCSTNFLVQFLSLRFLTSWRDYKNRRSRTRFRRHVHFTPFPLPRQGNRYTQPFIVRLSHSTYDHRYHHNGVTSYNIPQNGILFFLFVIINSGIQAIASGYLESAVVGVTALFGEQALQWYFTGTVVSIVRYVFTASLLHRERRIGLTFKQDGSLALFVFIFFWSGTLHTVISLIAHFTLVRSPLYCSVILFKDQKDVVDTTEETEPLISGEALGNSNRDDTEDDQAFLSNHRRMGTSQLLKDNSTITWKIVQANVLYKTSICSIYLVTLVRLFCLLPIECSLSVGYGNQSVFPPITATILSVNASQDSFFFSLTPALFTSLSSTLWITSAGLLPLQLIFHGGTKSLLTRNYLSLLSAAFPLFLSFWIWNINGSSLQSSPLIDSDIGYLPILLLFLISSGYLMNVAMMGASSVEYNYRLRNLITLYRKSSWARIYGGRNGTVEVDLAAKIAQFCLIGGHLLGSIMSFGVKSIICGGCNPFYTQLTGDTFSS